MHDDAPSEKPDPSLCGATGTRVPIIAPIAPKRVVFVLYDGFQPLDLAGPWQAFSSANEEAEAALYQLGTVAAEPVVATWDQGLRMQVDCTFSEDGDGPVDMIVVPGGPGVERASAHGETRLAAPARRRHAPHLQRLHRRLPAGLRRPARRPRRHHALALGRPAAPAVPALRVEDDRLYVDSGKYWTSAGVSAGIDLALIERDHGPELSQQVARRLVVFMPRRRPAPVQPDPAAAGPRRRAVPRAGAEDGGATVGPLVDRRHGRRLRHVAPHLPTQVHRAFRRGAHGSAAHAAASAPAPCRRPARCRRRKWKGTWGRWADRPAALACRRHGRPTRPHRHPAAHMDQLPGHEGGAPVHEHGHHVRHLFRQAAAAHRDRGLQRACADRRGFDALNSSVATGPGATVFTVMPSAASSSAQVRVMAASAPLDAP